MRPHRDVDSRSMSRYGPAGGACRSKREATDPGDLTNFAVVVGEKVGMDVTEEHERGR